MRARASGKSRQFGFVGFRTDAEAAAALKYFDRSFLGTYRLQVGFARPVGDAALERPWSRYSSGSSAFEQRTGANAAPLGANARTFGAGAAPETGKPSRQGGKKQEQEEDPKLREFLGLMAPRSQARVWSNDAGEEAGAAPPPAPVPTDKGDEDYEDLPSQLEEAGPAGASGGDAEGRPGPDGADGGPESDMDWLRGKVVTEGDDPSGAGATPEGSGRRGDEGTRGKGEEAGAPGRKKPAGQLRVFDGEAEEAPEDSGRLFIRNLPYSATEDDLRKHFEDHGSISDVHLVLDKGTHLSRGYGYVTYLLPESATQARQALDNKFFQGRLLHVLPATRRGWGSGDTNGAAEGGMRGDTGEKSGGYKAEKDARLKADAGNKETWSALYMRPETVAAWMADKFGVTKSEVLDPSAKDLAVRLALGEAQVVSETKEALATAGVNVASLDHAVVGDRQKKKAIARSDAVILVKNLPYETTENDLEILFSKYGAIVRLVLPPTKAIALVEFSVASCAKIAFKALAYRKFRHVPLYLEFAPAGIFAASAKAPATQPVEAGAIGGAVALSPGEKAMGGLGSSKAAHLADQALQAKQSGGSDRPEEAQALTIFVKNLSFATDDAALERHFKHALGNKGRATVGAGPESVRSAKVSYKTGKSGERLSNGYGFVEFSHPEAARLALDLVHGSSLDGFDLKLQLSTRDREGVRVVQKEKGGFSTSKLMVRNVAFEANQKDIKQLFEPFGELKVVRVPKKFDGSHRGFAFVDFIFRKDAKKAYEQLNGTHLLGRRLVIEKAKAEDEYLGQGLGEGSKRREPTQDDEHTFEPSAAAAGALNEKMSRQRKKKSRKE
tara:strand:+ start:118 stop:2637 length:2520 start_codon:yes stop_codon:yes gene_type:complete